MKKFILSVILLFFSFVFYGCDIIEGIFKAGVWVGVIIIVVIIALIAFVARLFRR